MKEYLQNIVNAFLLIRTELVSKGITDKEIRQKSKLQSLIDPEKGELYILKNVTSIIKICMAFDCSIYYDNSGYLNLTNPFHFLNECIQSGVLVLWNRELQKIRFLNFHMVIDNEVFIRDGRNNVVITDINRRREGFNDFFIEVDSTDEDFFFDIVSEDSLFEKDLFTNNIIISEIGNNKNLACIEATKDSYIIKFDFWGEKETYKISYPNESLNLSTSQEFHYGTEDHLSFHGNPYFIFSKEEYELVMTNKQYLMQMFNGTLAKFYSIENIKTTGHLISFLKNLASNRKKITLKLPNGLASTLSQFLNYFSEFVERSKGQKIRFDVLKRDDSLEIEIWANDEKDIDEIEVYLKEYTNLLGQDIDTLKVDVEINMSQKDFDFMILDLKNQIRVLKMNLESSVLQNKHLRGELKYIKLLGSKISSTNSSVIHISSGPKESYLELLANNKTKKCVNELKDHFKGSDVLKQVILQSSRLIEAKDNFEKKLIGLDDWNQIKNSVKLTLIDLVQEEM